MGIWAKNVFGQVGISANQGLMYRTEADVCIWIGDYKLETDLTVGKVITRLPATTQTRLWPRHLETEQPSHKAAGRG